MLKKIYFDWMDTQRYPIIQGGMGAGISLFPLASAVSKAGAMGTISSVALDQFTSIRTGLILNQMQACEREIFDTIKASGFAAINIMVKLARDYAASVEGAVKGGVNMIISGAGLPTDLPRLVAQYAETKEHKIALVPIVSSASILEILINRSWGPFGHLPDAVILEGPKAGGHLGFRYKDIIKSKGNFLKDYDLFNVLLDPVLAITQKYNIPLFVAGGIRTKEDVKSAISRGCCGVQIGTPFVPTPESGASDCFKQMILEGCDGDVLISDESWGSPAGYPFRYLNNSPLAKKDRSANDKYFCICTGLLASTNADIKFKKGSCPEGYVISKDGSCSAIGNVAYEGFYTSGIPIDGITEIRSVEEIIGELVE